MILLSPRRLATGLVLFSLLLARMALAAPAPATLIIGGKPVLFIVNPFVGPDGSLYAPVDAVRLLNAHFIPDTQNQTVTVTGEDNKSITVPYLLVQRRYCVPFQKVADALNASTDWEPASETLIVRARLLMVREYSDTLSIYTSYPVYYHVQKISRPNRVYVDLYGTDLAAQPADIPIAGGNIMHIRSGQMGYNTVRIVVDLHRQVPVQVQSPLATDKVFVALGRGVDQRQPMLPTAPAPPVAPLPVPGPVASGSGLLPPLPVAPPSGYVPAQQPLPPLPVLPPRHGVQITNVQIRPSGTTTQVLVTATGPTQYSTELLDNPDRLAFDLAGARLNLSQLDIAAYGNPFLKDVRVGIYHSGVSRYGRVVLDMQKMVPYTITQQPGENGSIVYAISLGTAIPPAEPSPLPLPGGLASLAGKVIVVDPGHGGMDSGAVGLGGVEEKNFTLAIGLKLRAVLEQAGAIVYMTRDTDVFIPLPDRPALAVEHNAALYVSIHCDKSGPDNAFSGTTVYYHDQNPICRELAADISLAVGAACTIPADGTRSDTVRFPIGFAVLRGCPMPAVLVECGYVNDESDLRKLESQVTQEEIADGIATGMARFLSGPVASR